MREKIINSLKKAFQSARVARISPIGIIATRFLVSIMITPIVLLSITYLLSFLQGYVSEEHGRLITVGSGIVDHVFTPPRACRLFRVFGVVHRPKQERNPGQIGRTTAAASAEQRKRGGKTMNAERTRTKMMSKVVYGISVLSILTIVIGILMMVWQDETLILPIRLILSGGTMLVVGLLILLAYFIAEIEGS